MSVRCPAPSAWRVLKVLSPDPKPGRLESSNAVTPNADHMKPLHETLMVLTVFSYRLIHQTYAPMRVRLGDSPKLSRYARANWLDEEKPVASATSSTGSVVSRNSCRARSSRIDEYC